MRGGCTCARRVLAAVAAGCGAQINPEPDPKLCISTCELRENNTPNLLFGPSAARSSLQQAYVNRSAVRPSNWLQLRTVRIFRRTEDAHHLPPKCASSAEPCAYLRAPPVRRTSSHQWNPGCNVVSRAKFEYICWTSPDLFTVARVAVLLCSSFISTLSPLPALL